MNKINFNNLELSDDIKPDLKPIGRIEYKDLERGGISIKINKKIIAKDEPGNKIPTVNYHSISQWCETCLDIKSHFHIPEKRKLKCSNCRKIKIY